MSEKNIQKLKEYGWNYPNARGINLKNFFCYV